MAKYHAFGTTFTWNGQVVAGLTSINSGDVTVDEIDSTTQQSADAIKEAKPGLITIGDITISGYFDATDTNGQLAMKADQLTRTTRAAVITFPAETGTTQSGSGFIKSLKIGEANLDNLIPFTATIKATGPWPTTVSAVVGMSGIGFSNDVLIMPAFAIGTFDYVVTITNGQTSTIVTPVDASAGEVITITAGGVSQTVGTGVASSAIPVAADEITEIVVVISHATKASKTYTFRCAVLAA